MIVVMKERQQVYLQICVFHIEAQRVSTWKRLFIFVRG